MSLSLDCVLGGGGWVVLLHGLRLTIQYTGSGASQEVQAKISCLLCLGPPGMSYRAICRWLLLMLGLEVSGRGQTES